MTMIDAMPTKRRKIDGAKPVVPNVSPRYPLPFLLSSLLRCQAPDTIAISSQSVIVTVAPRPNLTAIQSIIGDHYKLDLDPASARYMNKSNLAQVQQFHGHHTITHLQWNQRGTTLASIDETGKVALWQIGNASETWTLTYQVQLCQPVAAFMWLNTDRLYALDENEAFSRTKLLGPRNVYGYLGFLVVTAHGQVSVHYQRGGSIFSSFSSFLPRPGREDIVKSDMGCFGLSLAGLDSWQRISHASATFGQDGSIYLAVTFAGDRSRTVELFNLTVRFPGRANEGGLACSFVTRLASALSSITDQLSPGVANKTESITQLVVTRNKDVLMVVIGFGVMDENTQNFSSYLGRWTLQDKQQQSTNGHFGNLGFGAPHDPRKRQALLFTNGFDIPGRFITCITTTQQGTLALALSDGSIHIEDGRREDLSLMRSGIQEGDSSIAPTFWQAVSPHISDDGFSDTIRGLAFSPNETHIAYIFSSRRLGITRVTDRGNKDPSEHALIIEKRLKLSLLNHLDDLDLISELVLLDKRSTEKDLAERIVCETLKFYAIHCNDKTKGAIPANITWPDNMGEWSIQQLATAYGLILGVYRRLPDKHIEFVNVSKAIQLPVILECFIGACTSDFTDITQALDNRDSNTQLSFDPDSMWSLVSLTNWTLDYTRWILREWNMLLHCKRPKDSKLADISARPVHAALLVHSPSRKALRKTLVMIQQFTQFTTNLPFKLTHLPETTPLLRKYVSSILQKEPVSLKDILSFLTALDRLDEADQKDVSPQSETMSLLLRAHLPQDKISLMRTITAEFEETCAQPAIYLQPDHVENTDVLRKQRIPPHVSHVWRCTRCYQQCLPVHETPDPSDPCSYALWYRSLGRRCLCGGLFG